MKASYSVNRRISAKLQPRNTAHYQRPAGGCRWAERIVFKIGRVGKVGLENGAWKGPATIEAKGITFFAFQDQLALRSYSWSVHTHTLWCPESNSIG